MDFFELRQKPTGKYQEVLETCFLSSCFSTGLALDRKSLNLVTIEQVLLNLQTGRPPIGTRRSLPKIVKKISGVL